MTDQDKLEAVVDLNDNEILVYKGTTVVDKALFVGGKDLDSVKFENTTDAPKLWKATDENGPYTHGSLPECLKSGWRLEVGAVKYPITVKGQDKTAPSNINNNNNAQGQGIVISAGGILAEVSSLLKSLMDYKIHIPAMDEVAAHQKQKLGRFYRAGGIPCGVTAKDIRLVMLRVDNREPTTAKNEKLSAIIKDDIGKAGGQHIIALIGRSGAGKTSNITQLAREHFVIYMTCTVVGAIDPPDFPDRNFRKLVTDVMEKGLAVTKVMQVQTKDDLIRQDTELKLMVQQRVELDILAKLLFLLLLFQLDPALTPEVYFRQQVNGGADAVGKLVNRLQDYAPSTIRKMLDEVKPQVHKHFAGRGLIIAVDEAHLAEQTLPYMISPTALTNKIEFLNSKRQIRKRYRRSFLTPLSAALSSLGIGASVILSGTAFSLGDADKVHSSIVKPDLFVRVVKFPNMKEASLDPYLNGIVDLSACATPPAKRQKICGRNRFCVSPVQQLLEKGDTLSKTKQEVWETAVDDAIAAAKKELLTRISDLLSSDLGGGITQYLCRMVLAGKLYSSKITFPMLKQADFVDKGLCALQPCGDNYHWKMEEPLVLEVAEQALHECDVDPVYESCVTLLNGLLAQLGNNTTTKGNILEPIVRRALKSFNGKLVSELPFLGVSVAQLPKWCATQKLAIQDIGTADQLKIDDDLTFFVRRILLCLLCPASGTRPDGAWFFTVNYGGSLAIKFYTAPIAKAVHDSNVSSSDLRACFLQTSGEINPSLRQHRSAFEQSLKKDPIQGALRIHLEFPRSAHSVSRVDGDDVLVFITCDNFDSFFCESGADAAVMRDIKTVIRYVATQAKEDEKRKGCGCKTGCQNRCPQCFKQGKPCGSGCTCTNCKNKV